MILTAIREKFLDTAKLIEPIGWHIQLYTNLEVLLGLKETILNNNLWVVLDHLARIPADLGLEQKGLKDIFELLESGKVWMKMSAPQRISDNPDGQAVTNLAKKLIQINPDRLVWGSDWPHSGAHPGVPRVKENIEPFHPIDDGQALNRFAYWVDQPIKPPKNFMWTTLHNFTISKTIHYQQHCWQKGIYDTSIFYN
jgi:predicted TIM-barrel fold metal-dependent hydrolase